MRISAKGRYALASTISLAEDYGKGECTTVLSISEKLGISKIYLEQVFSLLKRGGIVNSVKGAQGGYQLARMPREITLYDILSAVELTLFEPSEATVPDSAPDIEKAMQTAVFEKIEAALKSSMQAVTLYDLVLEAEKYKSDDALMFYI
ncbi:transcriptional regulator, BadM/Rrf2 family [Sporobacter termitidis DSM 10068]|uniref:Transcriptional regulator, BadM/Rrf2 family n=1 Tax=Sporobacter termitidis DSM 10068 TaxID=1123282 RepID=A0A1M5Z2I6_9FIRM|nr:Rrf2 family transcriptional regulator [Sporobacter termitidis]SHI18093.1 transcriptional regulator, BadM/Rrf2 family [Sporobacter termitidis DSM 10068]